VLHLYLSSLGRKPGSDAALALLLDSNDLPSGWQMAHEWTYRTGAGQDPTHEIWRARSIKSVTARRFFRNQSSDREITTSVARYATASDAVAMTETLTDRLIHNPRSALRVTNKRHIRDFEYPKPQGVLIAYEEFLEEPGKTVGLRLVAGVVDDFAWNMNFSTVDGWWPWEDISSLAVRQMERVRAARREPSA
jgi:hypothetical protein